MANIGAGRGKEPVGALDTGRRGQGRGLGLRGILRGQTFAVLGIERRVAFEKRNFPLGLLPVSVRVNLLA